MLQMRQSMPNDLPCLRKYQVHPVHLPQMWVDCYPCQDTNEGETMKFDIEIELLLAELDELQKQYDSLWNYFNAHQPFSLSEWMKLQFRGEEE